MIFETLLWILVALLAVPSLVFILEVVCGLPPPRREALGSVPLDTNATILVPAHNEATVIGETLTSLEAQLTSADKVLVVADNCSDETADLVRARGHGVIERFNDEERGKGYALAYGIVHLCKEIKRPDVVVVVDADCQLAPATLAWLKYKVYRLQRPVQACNLMKQGEVDRLAIKVSEFAFMVKNKIRIRGLSRLGMPIPLTGTGMAFPWDIIASANLASGEIAEDMRLGVELAEKGLGATFCEQALVTSLFPTSEEAEKTQRERWEHGHLSIIRQFVPRLLARAVKAFSVAALGMALDLLIPPLSFLVLMILAVLIACVSLGAIWGLWLYASLVGALLASILLVVALVWLCYGRRILSVSELFHIPFYVIGKIAIYIGYAVRKQTQWIRTDRE